MRTLALPLLLYLAMTVGVPLVNGAPRDGAFAEHALLVVAGILVVGAVVARLTRAR